MRSVTVRNNMEQENKTDSLDKKQTQEAAVFSRDNSLCEPDIVVRTVNKILQGAQKQRASDIFIEPLGDGLQIRYRIDGILYKSMLLPKNLQESMVTRIKVMSGLDISEHRLPQDGRFKMNYDELEVDFRVSVVPSTMGEKIVLRVLDRSKITLDIDKLGLDPRSLRLIKANLFKPFGMIIVCGPTGSGKTTTLYSALKYVDSIEKNIVTVEDPVEYQLYGINQISVCEDIGFTFAKALRSILRQDPDVILVGEIRDFETADIAVKAALTGHLLLSTLHTISAAGSIVRLVNMGIEPFLIASSCLLVVSQVLARSLCPHCKEPYKPTEAMIHEFKSYKLIPAENAVIYKKKGCGNCNNTGFTGRVGLAETLDVNPMMKDLIGANASEIEIRDAAANEGMITLREQGLRLVSEGITSFEEVLRVTSLE